jgi:hypothetical protein
MPRKPAPIRFAADRGHRLQLIGLALFMVMVVFGSTRADEDFFRVAPPLIFLAWLVIALSRNRTTYDPDRKVLVWTRGIWPRLKKREFAAQNLLELKLDGNTKDLVSKTTLSATTDPDGEIVIFDKRSGVGSAELLGDIEQVSAEMGLSLYVDDSFEDVLSKSKPSQVARRIFVPILAVLWGGVCVAAAGAILYLTLVREGYEFPRYLHILNLYEVPEQGLSTGLKYEITLAMIVASGVWLAFKTLREGPRTRRKPAKIADEEDDEFTTPDPILEVARTR